MGLEVAKRLIRIFDTDRNGEIGMLKNINEQQQQKTIFNSIFFLILDFGEYCSLHSFLGKVYNSFIAADVDKSLKLDPPEIIGAMKVNIYSFSLFLFFILSFLFIHSVFILTN